MSEPAGVEGREMASAARRVEEADPRQDPPGIVIMGTGRPEASPRIAAFIWGGKVRPVPTLPFGRWKPAA